MEKNVGGIDLEELKRAREELMQERAETGEEPVSAFEPVQETSLDNAESNYADAQSSSIIDNPNVSRVFEREAPKQPEPQPEEGDDLDIDALVNEVFSGEYEDLLTKQTDGLDENEELDIDSMIGDSSNDIIDQLSATIGEEENESQPEVDVKPEAPVEEPVATAPASVPESSAEESRDFSVYDSFAAFEVNSGFAEPVSQPSTPEPVAEPEVARPVVEESQPVQEPEEDLTSKINSLMVDLNEQESSASDFELPTRTVEEVEEAPAREEPAEEKDDFPSFEQFAVEPEESQEPQTIPSVQEYQESEDGSLSSLGAFNFDQPKAEEPVIAEPVEEVVEETPAIEDSPVVEEPEENVSPETEFMAENTIIKDFEEKEQTEEQSAETQSDEDAKGEESAPAEEPAPVEEDTMSMVSSLSDLEKMMREDEERAAQLDEEIQKLERQVQTGELDEDAEEVDETPETASTYPKIEPYNFVDVISTDEFKDSDKLTYVIGKDEQGVMHYGNLRDNYNVVTFGRENEYTHNFVHSMLLSLILKNTINEVNFVICDSKADSKFEAYNKSSYMYFNRIAKTNKEILDILIELNKELEERYKLLAEIGVKSIEQYNIIAKNDNLKPLPYIVTVFNNYSKAIQLTESDKINTCLYQILKFGRIAGMYIILVANNTIMSNEINYNLPTRVSFKCDDSEMSLATLGDDGAESLAKDGDFLFSTVGAEGLVHLKVASLTANEIELLIENIED